MARPFLLTRNIEIGRANTCERSKRKAVILSVSIALFKRTIGWIVVVIVVSSKADRRICARIVAANAGIFRKQKNEEGKKRVREIKTFKLNRGLDLSFPFCKSDISFDPVSAVGFMNTPVSVVREDAIPILFVNAWKTPSAMSRKQSKQVAKNAANKTKSNEMGSL
jgi:hypothetical protein